MSIFSISGELQRVGLQGQGFTLGSLEKIAGFSKLGVPFWGSVPIYSGLQYIGVYIGVPVFRETINFKCMKSPRIVPIPWGRGGDC